MSGIINLRPNEIWKYFGQITQIPRASKKEDKMIQFLLDFAKEHQLEFDKDSVGNVVIRKPATMGMQNTKTVILQSHLDMVCEKNAEIVHNFDLDPIQTWIDGEWVKAKGTTLGGDDGIGIAACLAVLSSDSVKHGPLECFFTVDETSIRKMKANYLLDALVEKTQPLNLNTKKNLSLQIIIVAKYL